MKNYLRRIIKQAVISLITDDSSEYPRGQADYNGKTTDFFRYSPYGLISNPPVGSWTLLIGSQGQEAVKVGLTGGTINRKKEIKEGEIGLYNEKTESFILLNEDGDIELNPGTAKVIVNSSNVEIGTGTLDKLVKSLFLTAYDAHVHNDPVSGVTSAPTVGSLPTHKTVETDAS